jgi:hypothetical protein
MVYLTAGIADSYQEADIGSENFQFNKENLISCYFMLCH